MDSRNSNYLLTRYPRVSVIMAGHDPTGLAVKIEKKWLKCSRIHSCKNETFCFWKAEYKIVYWGHLNQAEIDSPLWRVELDEQYKKDL